MNSKELRQAAEYTVTMWDNHDSKRLVAGDELFLNSDGEPDSVTFARHILSAVREDDDEPVTHDWLASLMLESECDDDYFTIGEFTVNALGDTTVYGWSVWCHEYDVGDVKTRGQFRSLCRGLGIEMEEKDNAE